MSREKRLEDKESGKEMYKKFRDNTEVSALLAIFVGLVFVIFPKITSHIVGYVIGTVVIIAGLILIAKYIKKDVRDDYYSHELVNGISLIIIGILVYIKVEVLTSFFQPVLGLIVLYSGVMKLQTAIDLARMKYNTWKLVMILSGINILLAVLLLLNPGFLATFSFVMIGIALIYSGVSSLFASHFFRKSIKNEKKNEII